MHWSAFFVFVLATQGPKRKRISRWIAHSIHGLAFMAWHSWPGIRRIAFMALQSCKGKMFGEQFFLINSWDLIPYIYIYIHANTFMTSMKLLARAKATDFWQSGMCWWWQKGNMQNVCVHALSNEFACYMLPWKKSKSGMLSFFGRSAGLMDSPSGLVFCNFKS